MKQKNTRPQSEAFAAQLARDVATYDRMTAARPKKAPPMRLMPPVISAGQWELRKARKRGLAA